MTNKSLILSIALEEYNKNEELLVVAQKTGNYENVKSTRGIMWERDKEIGSLYHAYCEFCGSLFEDCAHYKKDCVKEATKKGWIIGNTKETKNIAVCPSCKEKYKVCRKVFKKHTKD